MATSPSGEPSRASGSGPSKSTTSAEHMMRVTRDAKIIDLRRDGQTYVQISSIVGVPKSTARARQAILPPPRLPIVCTGITVR